MRNKLKCDRFYHGVQNSPINVPQEKKRGDCLWFVAINLSFLFLELFRSLSGEELERLVLNGIAENSSMTDNDINLLSSQEDFDLESLIGR